MGAVSIPIQLCPHTTAVSTHYSCTHTLQLYPHTTAVSVPIQLYPHTTAVSTHHSCIHTIQLYPHTTAVSTHYSCIHTLQLYPHTRLSKISVTIKTHKIEMLEGDKQSTLWFQNVTIR